MHRKALAFGNSDDQGIAQQIRPCARLNQILFGQIIHPRLIDAGGTIQHIWATVKPAGHAAEVLAAVQDKAGTPPAG